MKTVLTTVLLGAAVFRLSAEEAPQAPDPDTGFRLALKKIEHDFIAGMRQLTARAAEVRVYRIGELKPDWGPFSTAPEGTVFTIQADGDDLAYTVLKAADPITKEEVIRMWAQTVLPEQTHPFAMCMPVPGFAIRFLDSNGEKVYATTICLKCQSASMEFPRYSDRIGFDPKAMEWLLKEAGFSAEDLKAEQADTEQPATRPAEAEKDGRFYLKGFSYKPEYSKLEVLGAFLHEDKSFVVEGAKKSEKELLETIELARKHPPQFIVELILFPQLQSNNDLSLLKQWGRFFDSHKIPWFITVWPHDSKAPKFLYVNPPADAPDKF